MEIEYDRRFFKRIEAPGISPCLSCYFEFSAEECASFRYFCRHEATCDGKYIWVLSDTTKELFI